MTDAEIAVIIASIVEAALDGDPVKIRNILGSVYDMGYQEGAIAARDGEPFLGTGDDAKLGLS